jgi:hypothetical protein
MSEETSALWSGKCACGCGAEIEIEEDRNAKTIDFCVDGHEFSVRRSDLMAALLARHIRWLSSHP